MNDWKKKFFELPRFAQDAVSKLADKYERDEKNIFSQYDDILITHHTVRDIQDITKKHQEALKILDTRLMLKHEGGNAWKKMIYNTSKDTTKEIPTITSLPDAYTPMRTYLYIDNFYRYDYKFALINEHVTKILEEQATTKAKNEIDSHIQNLTLDKNKKLQRDRHLIALDNCIFNTLTCSFEKFSPEKFIIRKIPVVYDKSRLYKDWSAYIDTIIDDPSYKDTLQEFVGYIFTDLQYAKKAVYCDGPTDSGKSVFMWALSNFLGGDACRNFELTDLVRPDNIVQIYDKLANIRSDIQTDLVSTDITRFKALTGGDPIEVRPLYEIAFSVINRAKFLFGGNGAPRLPEYTLDDMAFVGRWIPIIFNNRFKSQQELVEFLFQNDFDSEDHDAYSKEFVKEEIPDDTLRDLLSSEDMKSQILNWGIDGLIRLKKNHWHFTYEPPYEDVRNWFVSRVRKNLVDMFMTEKMEQSPGEHIMVSDAYQRYIQWCKGKKYTPLPIKSFSIRVVHNHLNIPITRRKSTVPPRNTMFVGVKWKYW